MVLRLIVLVLFTVTAPIFSQRYGEKKKYSSFGICLNAMNYVGELDPGPSFVSPSIRYTRPSFGLTYVRRIKPAISWRGTFTYGKIKGDDYVSASANGKNVGRKVRNLNFKNNIFELKGDLIYDFIGHNERYERRHEYVPYGFLGLAVFYSDPKGQIPDGFTNAGDWVKLRPLQTEGVKYSPIQMAIPFGLGFRYKLAKSWDLSFEVGWRYTFTDRLDDVSSGYGDPSKMSEMARLMSFKSVYISDQDLLNKLTDQNTVILTDQNGAPFTLPDGSPLRTVENFGGEYDASGTWKSDNLRGDKNKDWYIVTGLHLTYIPPLKVICPKFRY
jgi:hypothetical protein